MPSASLRASVRLTARDRLARRTPATASGKDLSPGSASPVAAISPSLRSAHKPHRNIFYEVVGGGVAHS